MPRLTNQEYLKRRQFIKALYDNEPHAQGILGHLKPNMQSSLHIYYGTAKDNLTDEELIEYRKEHQDEALGAGKAFVEIYDISINVMRSIDIDCDFSDLSAMTKNVPKMNKRIAELLKMRSRRRGKEKRKYKASTRVIPIMRSEIDTDKLAQTMILFAKQIARDPELKAEVEKIIARKKVKEAKRSA